MSSLNTTSSLVKYQLPEFIREDHPKFVEFLQKYYEYLEQPGNAVYELKRMQDNYDVDTARADLLTYFKSKILPSFPEKTELSTERIIKASRDFYERKGTPDSFKFLFRVLYDLDVEVLFPKLQILRASDGKWVQPQAFRLNLSSANEGFDVNLIEKCKGYGSISRASCIIEQANMTIDKGTGKEIVEIYVSGVNRFFQNGENLEVEYIDRFGLTQTFSEKIIGAISNIKINPKRRGTKYMTGDPVILSGGLDTTAETASKAIAYVGNVTTGSIDSVSITKAGYNFRIFPFSMIDIISTNGVGANVIISQVKDDEKVTIPYCTDSILYKAASTIGVSWNTDYGFSNAEMTYCNNTIGVGNTTTTVNLATSTFLNSTIGIAGNTHNNYYNSMALTVISGTGSAGTNTATIIAYNGTTKIATLSNPLSVAPDETSKVALFSNANTTLVKAFSYDPLDLAPIKVTLVVEGGAKFDAVPTLNAISVYSTDYSSEDGDPFTGLILLPVGTYSYYKTEKSIHFSSELAGHYIVAAESKYNDYYAGSRIVVKSSLMASHFRTVVSYDAVNRIAYLDRELENNINPVRFPNECAVYIDTRQNLRTMGRIAHIDVLTAGNGYSDTDIAEFVGTGYGAAASLTVSDGHITGITITNAGEGYVYPPTIVIKNSTGGTSTGTGAILQCILFADGEDFDVKTGKIGQIKDIVIPNRGSDYVETPNVSLKIYDIKISTPTSEYIIENDSLYQGTDVNNTTFRGTVDSYFKDKSGRNIVRVFNYSGAPTTGQTVTIVKTGVPNVTATILSEVDITQELSDGTIYKYSYPRKYGDGRAKANASFLNGLIKYNGYYYNTDGHISSDKKIQDSEKYHNFSYSLISDSSYLDYARTIHDIAHPSGTKLLPVRSIKNEMIVTEMANVNAQAVISTSSSFISNCNVDFDSTIVTGQNEYFDDIANSNNIIVINSDGGDVRVFSKSITAVGSNQMTYSQAFENWSISRSTVQTNLLTYSQTFDNAVWNTSALTRTSGKLAPDGSYTAYSFVETTTTAEHAFNYTSPPSLTSGVMYTASIRVKWLSGTRNIELRGGNNTGINKGVVFNSSGQFVGYAGGSNGTINSYSAVQGTNGWWTFSITFTSAATVSTGNGLFIYLYSGASATYTGDGTSGVYLWGAQLVVGSVAGDYRATTSAALPVLYTAPNSTKTAEIITNTTTSGYFYRSATSITVGQDYFASVYVKAGSLSRFWMFTTPTSADSGIAFFDISNGQTNAVAGTNSPYRTPTNLTITNAGNGWYRISAKFSNIAGAGVGGGYTSSMTTYTSPAGSYAYFWGWQVSSKLCDYIPTTSAAEIKECILIESPCTFIGEGRLITSSSSAIVTVYDNTNGVSEIVAVDDKIRFTLGTNTILKTVTDVTGNQITLNTSTGITTSANNILYEVLPKLNVVSYNIVTTDHPGD